MIRLVSKYNKALSQTFKDNDANTYKIAKKRVDNMLDLMETTKMLMSPNGASIEITLFVYINEDANIKNYAIKLKSNSSNNYLIFNILEYVQDRAIDDQSNWLHGTFVRPSHFPINTEQPQAQGGAQKRAASGALQKTKERFKYKKRSYVVYTGPRGGRYIKTARRYIAIAAL